MVKLHMTDDERDLFHALVRTVHEDWSEWPEALIVKWMTNKSERLCFLRAIAETIR